MKKIKKHPFGLTSMLSGPVLEVIVFGSFDGSPDDFSEINHIQSVFGRKPNTPQKVNISVFDNFDISVNTANRFVDAFSKNFPGAEIGINHKDIERAKRRFDLRSRQASRP